MTPAERALAKANAAYEKATQQAVRTRNERDAAMRAAHAEGMTVAEIAGVTGMTRQHVHTVITFQRIAG